MLLKSFLVHCCAVESVVKDSKTSNTSKTDANSTVMGAKLAGDTGDQV